MARAAAALRERAHAGRLRSRVPASLLVAAAVFPTAAALLYFVVLRDHPAAPGAYAATKVAQFLLPVLALAFVRARGAGEDVGRASSAARGLGAQGAAGERPSNLRELLLGAATGLALTLGILAARLLLHDEPALAEIARAVAQRIETFSLAAPARYAAFALFLSVAHSWLEEYYWRWFLLDRARDHVTDRSALVLSSLAFTAHHVVIVAGYVSIEKWELVLLGSAGVLAGGLVWGWLFLRGKRLLAPWASHLLADVAILSIGWELVRRATT